MEWAIPVAAALIATAGTFATAWFAWRAKKEETRQTGWGTLSTAWERRLQELEDDTGALRADVRTLRGEVDSLTTELRAERRRTWVTTAYLRQVLAWICTWKPPDQALPEPPHELVEELTPYLRGIN